MPNSALQEYQTQIAQDIESCVSQMGCQPILFVGSGFTKRYFNGPSWDELLAYLAKECPLIARDYAYYKQTYRDPLEIGEIFADSYQQWAWDNGKNQFPTEMFSENTPKEAYVKYKIGQYLQSIVPQRISDISDEATRRELELFQNIKPHAVITTNYDQFLELIFPEFEAVIGQKIIQNSQVLIGEIFKIHGCVSDSKNIIFTKSDYAEFTETKQYLSAKLLTYFSEHPLLLVGYSATDPNIRSILSDIDRCIPRNGTTDSLIPNIYILQRRSAGNVDEPPPKEKLIEVGTGRSIRIKAIETDDFGWVFSAFGALKPLNSVSPKILRSILHRSHVLVRQDIPRLPAQVNFQMLEDAAQSGPEFAKLFGITTISSASSHSVEYPHTLTDLSEKILGRPHVGKGQHWHLAGKYLNKIFSETGKNIRCSDNKYHSCVKTGRTSTSHKYSNHCLELLKKIHRGEAYDLDM